MKKEDPNELDRVSSSQCINGDKYFENSKGRVIARMLKRALYVLGECKQGEITGYRLVSGYQGMRLGGLSASLPYIDCLSD